MSVDESACGRSDGVKRTSEIFKCLFNSQVLKEMNLIKTTNNKYTNSICIKKNPVVIKLYFHIESAVNKMYN